MKYVISVSKTYKHRGLHRHRASTKKYWHIYYYDEDFTFHSEQVSYLEAMYYKSHKYKKIYLHCPNCNVDNLHFIKKRDTKHILKEGCGTCFCNYKDILEEIEN